MKNSISFLNTTEHFSPKYHVISTEHFSPKYHLTSYLANSYSKIHQSNHGNGLHFYRAWRNIHQYQWNSFCL